MSDDDEARRLRAVQELHLLGTPAEERFDKLTRLARRLFDVPVAFIDIVGESRAWLKSAQGLDCLDVPRAAAAAQIPLAGGAVLRFQAGWPLYARGGERVGTLCIGDHRPRSMGEEKLRMLRQLAELVE